MELEPCPFCGNDEPRLARRLDESLWSHETVEWVHITCDECDCESVSSEVHDDVIAAWNRRASIPPITPVEAGKVGVAAGVAVVQPNAPKPMQGLADWLRAVADTQAADAANEGTMLRWAREVDAACGVMASDGSKAE